MTVGDDYRARAAQFRAEAEKQTNPTQRAKYEALAKYYMRLAEHADKNSGLIIDVELPPEDEGKTKH